MQLHFQFIFLQCIRSLQRDYNITTNVYAFIVSSCSSEEASPVLSLLGKLEAKKKQGYCEALQRADWRLVQVCAFSTSLKSVCFFSSIQSRGIWAAPLMMVFVAGSGTKTGTCTGRRRLIHQVIEGQLDSPQSHVCNTAKCLFYWQELEITRAVLLHTRKLTLWQSK